MPPRVARRSVRSRVSSGPQRPVPQRTVLQRTVLQHAHPSRPDDDPGSAWCRAGVMRETIHPAVARFFHFLGFSTSPGIGCRSDLACRNLRDLSGSLTMTQFRVCTFSKFIIARADSGFVRALVTQGPPGAGCRAWEAQLGAPDRCNTPSAHIAPGCEPSSSFHLFRASPMGPGCRPRSRSAPERKLQQEPGLGMRTLG